MQFENPSKTLFVPLAHVHSIVLVVKLARQSNIKWWEQNGILIPFTSINPDFAEELGNALTGGIFTGSFHECIIPYEDELSCTSKLNEVLGNRIMNECCCFIQHGRAEVRTNTKGDADEVAQKEIVELNFGIAVNPPPECEHFVCLVPLTVPILPSFNKLTNPKAGGALNYY